MLSRVHFFVTPGTVARQAPLSMGFSQARILEWVAISFPGDLPRPRIEPESPGLQADSTHPATREAPMPIRVPSKEKQRASHGSKGSGRKKGRRGIRSSMAASAKAGAEEAAPAAWREEQGGAGRGGGCEDTRAGRRLRGDQEPDASSPQSSSRGLNSRLRPSTHQTCGPQRAPSLYMPQILLPRPSPVGPGFWVGVMLAGSGGRKRLVPTPPCTSLANGWLCCLPLLSLAPKAFPFTSSKASFHWKLPPAQLLPREFVDTWLAHPKYKNHRAKSTVSS